MMVHAMPGTVETAIARASDLTGVDASFLLGEAQRESRFDPKARAPSSSASGLYQFIDQTWLATLKRHGAKYGYARYADLIRQEGDGRYAAVDTDARAAVMSLRLDPRAAALMAGEMATDHAQWLSARMGRAPTAGELYVAHFLGREGAAVLVEMNALSPNADAARIFPAAARANPTLFRSGARAVTVAELYGELTAPPAAAGGHAAAVSADPFLRYAAARRAERVGAHHALVSAVIARGGQHRSEPAKAPAGEESAATTSGSGGWLRPPA